MHISLDVGIFYITSLKRRKPRNEDKTWINTSKLCDPYLERSNSLMNFLWFNFTKKIKKKLIEYNQT